MGKIFDLLNDLSLTSELSRYVFSKGTRDVENLIVWRDQFSKIIYIDDFYIGDEEYSSINFNFNRPDYERYLDSTRRIESFKQFYIGKDVCDFGCGEGLFLKGVKKFTKSRAVGVDLQDACIDSLQRSGISCRKSVSDYSSSFDTIFMFHSFEHFDNPLEKLLDVKNKLRKGGKLVIEVPNANDILLTKLPNEDFKKFTLWSQHLILHTRVSLEKMLTHVGFKNLYIYGVQRYPLSNHFNWLSNGEPGGHRSLFSVIDNEELNSAYENSLSKIDATDTLVAIAEID